MSTMKLAWLSGRRLALAVVALLALAWSDRALAVDAERGPMYLTDSHGASGVVHSFLELSAVDPAYDKYWRGALDWLIAVAQKDDAGRVRWPLSASAPAGHKNRQINLPSMCHITRMFVAGYERSHDDRYKQTALASVRFLAETAMLRQQTPFGAACGWSHSYHPKDKSAGVLAGHSHGLGNFLDVMLDACRLQPDEKLKDVLRGILVNLRSRAREVAGQKDMIVWPLLQNEKVVETGYCYGQAGLILPLLTLAERFPDLRLSDGTTALSLANASLRYLMHVARAERDACVWPHMRHEEQSRNIGYGSGTGGIGWAFLRGAQVNRKTDPAFADECLKRARGAAMYAVDLAARQPETRALTSPGGDGGFGVCGGAGGAGHFLMLLAQEIDQSDAAFAARLKATMERLNRILVASAVPVDGTLAWKKADGTVSVALDYGQTGPVLALSAAGKYLKSDEFIQAARRGADFIVKHAAAEAGGYKFPFETKLAQ
ncbi:MAG: hypothetical protein HZA91_02450 [Verrucomicrobia bacterium]|nr:hypothetical protein [Verrucomicrobiota bacterium]